MWSSWEAPPLKQKDDSFDHSKDASILPHAVQQQMIQLSAMAKSLLPHHPKGSGKGWKGGKGNKGGKGKGFRFAPYPSPRVPHLALENGPPQIGTAFAINDGKGKSKGGKGKAKGGKGKTKSQRNW